MKPATKIPFYPAFTFSFILRVIIVCLLVVFNSRFSVFSQYSETLYGIDKGLTHNTVLDIDEDEDGFIWVFTSFGLCRFDGFGFKEYTVDFHNYERTIPFNGRILKDSKKRLWVDSALPNILISDIEHDRINVAIQIAYHDFYDIEDDGYGNYLFASIFSILRLREEQNSTFSYRELMVPDNAGSVNSLCRLEDGTILATGQNGFFKLTITEDSVRADEIRLTREGRYLKYLISDSTRILLAHDQLFLIQRQEILMPNISPSGYSDDSVCSTEPLNLDFPEIGLYNGLPIFAVIEGRKDELFIRNLNGIYSYNIKSKTAERIKEESYGSADWSEGDFRQAMYYSSDDILWAGTDQGLLKIVTANKAFHSILPEPGNPHGLKVAKTRNVMIDSKGDLWLGSTAGGLFHSKQEADGSYRKFRNYVSDSTNFNSLNINHISALFEDSQNRLWVGTDEIQWMDINKPGIFYYAMGVPFSGNIRTVITVDDFLEDTIGNILATCIGGITWLFSPDLETGHVILLDSTRSIDFANMLFTKNKELYLYDNCHFYKLKLPWVYKLCDGSDPRHPLFRACNDPRIKKYVPIPWVNPSEFEDLFNLDSLHALVERFVVSERDSKKTLWLTVTALKKVLRIDLDKVENEYHSGKEIKHSGFKLFPAEEEGFIQTFKIIEDKNGIIWCAGNEGLLRIDPYT
ncbi:MAG: hypothetical protein IH594_17840, partial [Bacteroidales bacterium]|nr:hypothetical protein [Bacteroidales bacterium]